MYEIYLRFEHECPYSDISRTYPAARFALWDNFRREFLEARSTIKDDWPAISKDLGDLAKTKGSRILRKAIDRRGYQFLLMTCACERRGSTLDMVMASDCLFVPPIRFEAGRETYHVLAFDRGASARLLRKFNAKGKAAIESRTQVDVETFEQSSVTPIPNPLTGMTSMQLNALATSMSLGYYQVPRRTSTGKIAESLKVPRTTFQDHRKKAESKLMTALAPYVMTFVGGPET